MIRCVHCGMENEPIFTYCLSCGKPLEQSLSGYKPQATHSTGKSGCSLFAVRPDGGLGAETPLSSGLNRIGKIGPEVVVRDDPRVADRHAELEVGRSEAFLEDLGTPHGTFMRIVGERQLSDGDEVRIGHALFRLQFAMPLPAVSADGTMVLGSIGASADGFGRLLRLGPNGTVFEARILRGAETVIGRTGGDIVLGDDPFVSSRHAAFTRTPTGCTLRDLGSTNGCYLRLRGRVALRDGDHFMVGHHLYLFRRGKEN